MGQGRGLRGIDLRNQKGEEEGRIDLQLILAEEGGGGRGRVRDREGG